MEVLHYMFHAIENQDEKIVHRLAELVQEVGGTTYYVGGYVRDKLLERTNKDIDIEVHGITIEQLEAILKMLGEPIAIGNSFGIFTLRHTNIDISLPRKENDSGRGKQDVASYVDPFVGTEKAARRRDLTINALMMDVLTGKIIDYFSGLEDIKRKIIRHVNEVTFAEDPLRVLRAAQFASRLNFSIADETVELAKQLDLTQIPRERIFVELEKALLKSDKPSVFFEELRKMEQLDYYFPEVKKLIGVPQDLVHHPEGDVWNHTMMVLDAAAEIREQANYPIGFMLSALCHDFGKTEITERVDGKIHSYKHECEGIPIAVNFLERLTNMVKLKDYIVNMISLHMKPRQMASQKASVKSMCKMFDEAISCEDLVLLSKADSCNRRSENDYFEMEKYLQCHLDIYQERISLPAVTGQDLVKAGFTPGKDFNEALAYAHKLQLSGVKKETALKHTISYIRKNRGE